MIGPSPNPPCPHCNGLTHRWGNSRGKQQLKCIICGKQFRVAPYLPIEATRRYSASRARTNLHCIQCRGLMVKHGRAHGKQYFACRRCKVHYMGCRRMHSATSSTNPLCITCRNLMHKRGFHSGQRYFYCRTCKTYYRDGRQTRSRMPPPSPAIRQARQQQAALLDASLLDLISAALPDYLPFDVREDVMQETAVAALDGEFDLSEMARMVPYYRRRINRLSSDRFRFVSLSQPIPYSNGLTYADVIAG